MINVKADLCQYLKQKSHPLYKHMFDDNWNETGSNLLDPCPIKVTFLLCRKIIRNVKFTIPLDQGHRFFTPYYTTYDLLPPFIPTGMWRIDIKITKDDEEVLKVQNYYEVTAKGIIEF